MAGRVAFVIDELEVGGSQRQLHLMATGLASRGWAVHVVCLQAVLTLAEEFEAAGIPVHPILKRRRFDLRLIGALRSFFVRERIDVVHAFSSTAEFFGGLAARSAGCRFITSLRNVAEPLPLSHRAARRLAARLADGIVANSQAAQQEAVASGLAPRSKIHVIPNGLDVRRLREKRVSREEARALLDLPLDAVVIGLVGRLVRQKGYEVAIDIARRVVVECPDVLFVVAGDGPLREALAERIQALGLEKRVLLLGEVRDMGLFLSAMDIFLSTSHWEGMSNSIMEAMAFGLPVVATAVGGTPELIENGRNGVLIPAGDPERGVDQLCRLLADADLWRDLGEKALAWVEVHSSPEALADRLQNVYGGLRPTRTVPLR